MTVQFRGQVFSGLYRYRNRLLWAGLAVLSGVAVAGWSVWGDKPGGMPMSAAWNAEKHAGDQAAAPALATADEIAIFKDQCQVMAARRLVQQARKNCQRFVEQPALAGQAHAALAALLAEPPLLDLDAAVDHARQAVRLGDARGDFILALFMLAGHAQPWNAAQVDALLAHANSKGLTIAAQYQRYLATQRDCPLKASLKPLDVPLFCLFRAEVLQQLEARGMQPRVHQEDEWRDEFSPGDAIGAQAVDLEFDTDPREQLPRLARMRYVFEAGAQGTVRWRELFEGLSRRYGTAQSVQQGLHAVWPMPDGTVVRLSREGERCLVAYEHPQRLQLREQHLAQVRDGVRQARLLAEAHAL